MIQSIELSGPTRERVAFLHARYLQSKRELNVYLQAIQDALGLEGEWDLDTDLMVLAPVEVSPNGHQG